MANRRLQLASTASLGILALVAFGSPAHADNISWTSLQINNFLLTPSTQFSSLTVNNASGDGATLNGAGSAPGSATGTATADVTGQCVGNCTGITENQMGLTGSPPPITQVFSRGDAYVTPSTTVTGAYNAGTVAEAQLTGTAKAYGSGTAGTNANFRFSGVTSVTMSFSAVLQQLAENLVPGGSIQTYASWKIALYAIGSSSTTELAEFTPTGNAASDLNILTAGGLAGLTGSVAGGTDTCTLQQNTFASVSPQTNTYSCSSDYGLTLNGLNSSTLYQLQISQQVHLTAKSVPEPKTLGMLAMGLLGVGFFVRRRQRKA